MRDYVKRIPEALWGVRIIILALFCAAGLFLKAARGADNASADVSAAEAAGSALPTAEELDKILEDLRKGKEQQDSEEKKKQYDAMIDTYEKAKTQLQAIQKYEGLTAEFQEARTKAPDRLTEIQAQLNAIPAEPEIQDPYAEWTSAQIEQYLAQLDAKLAEAKKEGVDCETETKKRAARKIEIPEISIRVKEQLDTTQKELNAKADPAAAADVVQSRQVLLLCTARALARELAFYQEEVSSYDTRRDLLSARRDLAARQAAQYEKLIQKWQEILTKRRKADAERDAEKARQASREAAQSHPIVRHLAEENTTLAELRTGAQGLVAKSAAAGKAIEKVGKQLSDLESDFQSIMLKVRVAGLSDVVGVLLLGKRDTLPEVRVHQRNIESRRAETSMMRFEWIQYDEEYASLSDLDSVAERTLEELDASMDSSQKQQIGEEVKKLLADRRELIYSIIGEYENYLKQLADLDVKERELVSKTEEYADYIDENILWIKNMGVMQVSRTSPYRDAFFWLVSPRCWGQAAGALDRDMKANPRVYGAMAILLMILYGLRRRSRRRIDEISNLLHKKYIDRFSYTLNVLVFTVLLAVFIPAVFYFIGWRLTINPNEPEFVMAAAAGFDAIAVVYLAYAFIQAALLPKGLAVVHFQMPSDSIAFVRKHLSWYMGCILPLIFSLVVLEQQSTGVYKESLGRLIFILVMGILSAFLILVMRPSGRLVKPVLEKKRGGWLEQLQSIWFSLLVCVPLAMILLAVLGYFYTAQQLMSCLQTTLRWFILLVILFGLTLRWLIVSQNRLAIQKERERMSSKDKKERDLDTMEQDEESILSAEEELKQISLKMSHFIRTLFFLILFAGLWMIWKDVLPALNLFNRVELWKTTIADKTVSITLGNFLLALIILFLTILAARNIPGLLELVFLQRLPLNQGVRFAIVTLTRYILVVAGVVMTFGQIGIGWSTVQWLVAAISVGLGFGLQEIFANFISGLIILFEQPMRVGDYVTVGDISGRVTRIHIRATTIRKWDRKELVVPNKEFITGRLINWTLSDTVLRMDFSVGIAYGSDTALTEKTLLDVAKRHPTVMQDPAPFVIFKAFGSSALEFDLRLYIPDLDHYLTVWHEVNRSIDEAFRKAKIEIAFPQRDVHVRSIQTPIPIETQRSGGDMPK